MISFLGKWLLSYQHLGVFQKKHSTPDGQTNIDTKRHALLLFRDLGTSYRVQRQLARQRPAERKQIAKIHRDKDRQTQRTQTCRLTWSPAVRDADAQEQRAHRRRPGRLARPPPRPQRPLPRARSGQRRAPHGHWDPAGGTCRPPALPRPPGPAPRDRSGRTRGRWGRRRGWGQGEGFGRPGTGAGGRTRVGQSWRRAQASGAGSGPRGSPRGREGCPGHCGVRGRGR